MMTLDRRDFFRALAAGRALEPSQAPSILDLTYLSRRGFLQSLVAGAAALTVADLDPERILWVPGARRIFLPPPVEIVAPRGIHSMMTIDLITQEALKVLENNMAFAQAVNRQYERGWATLPGITMSVSTPSRFRS